VGHREKGVGHRSAGNFFGRASPLFWLGKYN